jgi:ABC-type glutathione transport system ATPase component
MISDTEQASSSNGDQQPLLEIDGLKKYFPVKGGVFMKTRAQLKAVDDVSLSIQPGETLGLVGESGCGKSTLGKCVCRLYEPTGGHIRFMGETISDLKGKALKPYRKDIQMIFQDPAESLNSRHSIGNILEEPLLIHGVKDGRSTGSRLNSQVVSVSGSALPGQFH